MALNRDFLESLLNTPLLHYDVIRHSQTLVFRVKIPKSLLHNAIILARQNGCVAYVLGGIPSRILGILSNPGNTCPHITICHPQEHYYYRLDCMSPEIPYINHLVDSCSDIIILFEC